MIEPKNAFIQRDQDAERRRALGKVYALLIRLAEEAERAPKPSVVDSNAATSEDLSSSSSAQEINQESCVLESPETPIFDTSNEPLQKNIPS
jgi:hypothetical protein